jgi:hypothetical protein
MRADLSGSCHRSESSHPLIQHGGARSRSRQKLPPIHWHVQSPCALLDLHIRGFYLDKNIFNGEIATKAQMNCSAEESWSKVLQVAAPGLPLVRRAG